MCSALAMHKLVEKEFGSVVNLVFVTEACSENLYNMSGQTFVVIIIIVKQLVMQLAERFLRKLIENSTTSSHSAHKSTN
jgi:hypothetical protein